MAPEVACKGPGHRGKTTGTVLRLCVETAASGPTNPGKNTGSSTKSAFIVEDLDIFQKCAGKIQMTSIVTGLRSNT